MKHKLCLFHLLSQAPHHNLLPQGATIVPHQLDPRDISYEGLVNGHNNYIAKLCVIPIIGLSTEAASHKAANDVTYLQHLSEKIKAVTIQPTTRTADLGKRLVQVRQDNYQKAEDFIDIKIPRTYSSDIPVEKHLVGFPFPRRTQIPLRTEAMGEYANTLRILAKEGMDLPQATPQKPWRKQTPLTFHTSKDHFPPLPNTPKRTPNNQHSAQPNPSNAIRTPNNQIINQIKQMEEKHKESLQKQEKQHKEEMNALMQAL